MRMHIAVFALVACHGLVGAQPRPTAPGATQPLACIKGDRSTRAFHLEQQLVYAEQTLRVARQIESSKFVGEGTRQRYLQVVERVSQNTRLLLEKCEVLPGFVAGYARLELLEASKTAESLNEQALKSRPLTAEQTGDFEGMTAGLIGKMTSWFSKTPERKLMVRAQLTSPRVPAETRRNRYVAFLLPRLYFTDPAHWSWRDRSILLETLDLLQMPLEPAINAGKNNVLEGRAPLDKLLLGNYKVWIAPLGKSEAMKCLLESKKIDEKAHPLKPDPTSEDTWMTFDLTRELVGERCK